MSATQDDCNTIQVNGGIIFAADVLKVGDIEFVGEDTGGSRARKFTITYGDDRHVLTEDIVDDDHLMRERLEGVRNDIIKKSIKAKAQR